jgi:hypothetical protein
VALREGLEDEEAGVGEGAHVRIYIVEYAQRVKKVPDAGNCPYLIANKWLAPRT